MTFPPKFHKSPDASITLNVDSPSLLQSIYCAISQRSACILLTESFITAAGEIRLMSLDSGRKALYELKLSGSSITVNVWAEDPQQARLKAQEVVEKSRQTQNQWDQLATILWELDRAVSLLLSRQTPMRQVYQLLADARERIILAFGFHPVTLQMAETLHRLTGKQDETPDPKTARTLIQKIFCWKKQL
ncbi:MAG: hypothetical protein QXK94_05195 [Candidatus Jordarchaeales archaeon]